MKNTKSFICNTLIAVVSVLFLVFMSQAHFTLGESYASGYDCIDFSASDAKVTFMALGLLFGVIISCVMLLTSIYGILRNFNVIKANKADKIVKIVNVVLASVLVFFMFLALIMDICIVAEMNEFLAIYSIGWAIAVNFVLVIGVLVASILDRKTNK